MQLVKDALRQFDGVIGDKIDWDAWLHPEDAARVIAAESLAEQGKARLLLGGQAEEGLTLPWPKAQGKVLIKPGKVAIWTGWSHHGKTAMLKQLMLWAIKHGERPLIASMEEEIAELWHDLAILGCGTSEPTASNVDSYIRFIKGNLFFYDQQGTVEPKRLQALIRYAHKTHGITQMVIDSLMMLAVDRDNYEQQARFVSELKAIAKDTGVTVHLVAHMRKKQDKDGEKHMGNIHDISGGHEIASMADYVFNVWRNKQNDADKPAALLGVEKQRGRINYIGKFGLNCHNDSRQFTETNFPMRFYD